MQSLDEGGPCQAARQRRNGLLVCMERCLLLNWGDGYQSLEPMIFCSLVLDFSCLNAGGDDSRSFDFFLELVIHFLLRIQVTPAATTQYNWNLQDVGTYCRLCSWYHCGGGSTW